MYIMLSLMMVIHDLFEPIRHIKLKTVELSYTFLQKNARGVNDMTTGKSHVKPSDVVNSFLVNGPRHTFIGQDVPEMIGSIPSADNDALFKIYKYLRSYFCKVSIKNQIKDSRFIDDGILELVWLACLDENRLKFTDLLTQQNTIFSFVRVRDEAKTYSPSYNAVRIDKDEKYMCIDANVISKTGTDVTKMTKARYMFGPYSKVLSTNAYKSNKDSFTAMMSQKDNIMARLRSSTTVVMMGYGASGSGKTSFLMHLQVQDVGGRTMADPGIVYYMCHDIVVTQKETSGIDVTSYECYDNKCPNNGVTTMSFDNTLTGTTGNKVIVLHEYLKKLIDVGRVTKSTPNNAQSSRGHVIIKIAFKNTKFGDLIVADFAGNESEFNCRAQTSDNVTKQIPLYFDRAYYKRMFDQDIANRFGINDTTPIETFFDLEKGTHSARFAAFKAEYASMVKEGTDSVWEQMKRKVGTASKQTTLTIERVREFLTTNLPFIRFIFDRESSDGPLKTFENINVPNSAEFKNMDVTCMLNVLSILSPTEENDGTLTRIQQIAGLYADQLCKGMTRRFGSSPAAVTGFSLLYKNQPYFPISGKYLIKEIVVDAMAGAEWFVSTVIEAVLARDSKNNIVLTLSSKYRNASASAEIKCTNDYNKNIHDNIPFVSSVKEVFVNAIKRYATTQHASRTHPLLEMKPIPDDPTTFSIVCNNFNVINNKINESECGWFDKCSPVEKLQFAMEKMCNAFVRTYNDRLNTFIISECNARTREGTYINSSLHKIRSYMTKIVKMGNKDAFPAIHPRCSDTVSPGTLTTTDIEVDNVLSAAIGKSENIAFCVVGVIDLTKKENNVSLSQYVCTNEYQRDLHLIYSASDLQQLLASITKMVDEILNHKNKKDDDDEGTYIHHGTKRNMMSLFRSKPGLFETFEAIGKISEKEATTDAEYIEQFEAVKVMIDAITEFNSTNPLGILGYVDNMSKLGLTHSVCRVFDLETDPFIIGNEGQSKNLMNAAHKNTTKSELAVEAVKRRGLLGFLGFP